MFVSRSLMFREERVKDSLRKAEQDRLGRKVTPARPRLMDQALASVGGLLISTGKKLQTRHARAQARLTGSLSPASQ